MPSNFWRPSYGSYIIRRKFCQISRTCACLPLAACGTPLRAAWGRHIGSCALEIWSLRGGFLAWPRLLMQHHGCEGGTRAVVGCVVPRQRLKTNCGVSRMNPAVEKNVWPKEKNRHFAGVEPAKNPRCRLLRLPEVLRLTGYKRSSIYGKTDPKSRQFDPTFPRRVQMTEHGRGAVGWFESEILAWLESRGSSRVESCAMSRASH